MGNILPDETSTLWELYSLGRFSEAEELQRRLVAVNDITTIKYGIGGLKYACEKLGYPTVP